MGGASDLGIGPFATQVSWTQNQGEVQIIFEDGTAANLHSHGTAACDTVGSKLCCGESPFEVNLNGNWVRVDKWRVQDTKVVLEQVDTESKNLRYDWEYYPQCALYNGEGGPEDHAAIAATPFRIWIEAAPKPEQCATTCEANA